MKDFQKQLNDSIASLIINKIIIKIIIIKNINGQSITISGGKNFVKIIFAFEIIFLLKIDLFFKFGSLKIVRTC